MPHIVAADIAGFTVPVGLIIFAIWAIAKWAGNRSESAPASPQGASLTSSGAAGGFLPGSGVVGSLELRTRWVTDSEAWPSPHFLLECRGSVPTRRGCEIAFRHRLLDVTDPDDPKAVVAVLDWQQFDDSVLFSDITQLGAATSNFQEWSTWSSMKFPIFPEMIRTARSGERQLLSIVDLVAVTKSGLEVLWEGSLTTAVTVQNVGYEEFDERQKIDDGLIIRLGVAVAASAGEIESSELHVIRHAMENRVSYMDDADDDKHSRLEEMDAVLQRSIGDSQAGSLDIGATISRFVAEGTHEARVEAVELALAVMKADGSIDSDEMVVVKRLADQLDVDPGWFAETRDKAVSGMNVQAESASAYGLLLGIDATADPETIRRQLAEQYDRWSSRAVSISDPEKRREAEDMLELVAKARQELLG
jgi:tellurite resistance protein